MKRLAPTGYQTSEQSREPGYLERRFAKVRRELRDADERQAAVLKEALEKVSALPAKRRAAG